jgi:iron(III) transport system permease protein
VTGKGYKPKLTDLGRWARPAAGFVILYYVIDLFLPFLAMLWTSLVSRIQLPSIEGFKMMNVKGYLTAIRMLGEGEVLVNTVQLVVFVGVLSVVVSLVLSWIVLRTRLPGRFALDTISMIPHAIPTIAFAFSVAYVALLLVKQIPFFYGSLFAIVLADTIRRLPFATRTISGSLIQIHPELEEAVQTCGGSRMVALRKVITPLIIPALFYSFVWTALHAYREVSIALFLQSPRNMVMATAIWQRWQSGESSAAAALGVIMILGMGAIVLTLLKIFPQIFGERRG